MGRFRYSLHTAAGSLVVLSLACTAGPDPSTPADASELPLEVPELAKCVEGEDEPSPVVVATWNMGAARRDSLAAVQAQIAALDADVVLLQEVDVGVRRTDEEHQAALLADALGYDYVFAASLEWDGGVFGLTTLSRFAVSGVERISLEGERPGLGSEPRIALDVRVCAPAGELRFVNVHADFVEDANANNLEALGDALARFPTPATLVGGDFNTAVDAPAAAALLQRAGLVDILSSWDAGPTRRQKRIDFLFGPPTVATRVTQATRVETTASDHRALVVEFSL